ncbi:alpha/beta hydrolase [Streptomyces sp. AHA2]|uniref:alpha/beta hydrolase n=1 Tax=Streptomyces sp. AHA2 TaxID=3064526 RepID=UPI002FE1D4B6
MRRLLLPAFAALTVAGAAALSTTASTASSAQGTRTTQTVRDAAASSTHRYGTHPRQTLDAHWKQSGSGPRPALVLIHGGYWYHQTDWSSSAERFAAEGFQVFAIRYRLNFEAGWPAQRDDVADAVAWIRSHAADFDVDPDRVLLLGSSAGGQLATDAATHGANGLRLKGVVALSPVASPYRAYNDGNSATDTKKRKLRDNAVILARCHPDSKDTSTTLHPSCWETWRSMVSKNWVDPADAPMYLIHSDDDFVPPTHSTDLEATAESRGVPSGRIQTHVVTGSAHGGSLLSEPGVFDRVVVWLKGKV